MDENTPGVPHVGFQHRSDWLSVNLNNQHDYAKNNNLNNLDHLNISQVI